MWGTNTVCLQLTLNQDILVHKKEKENQASVNQHDIVRQPLAKKDGYKRAHTVKFGQITPAANKKCKWIYQEK